MIAPSVSYQRSHDSFFVLPNPLSCSVRNKIYLNQTSHEILGHHVFNGEKPSQNILKEQCSAVMMK